MGRAKWKGFFSERKVFSQNNLKIWSRSSSVPESLIGKSVLIHNGKDFKKILVTREKVGYKLGAFSFTKKHTIRIKSSKLVPSKKKS